MKNPFLYGIAVCVYVIAAATAANAQIRQRNIQYRASRPASTGTTAAKVPVVIVGSAAKLTWATTKFTANHLARPAAKALFVTATPAVTKYVLRNSAKYVLPFAARLSVL